MMKKLMLYLPVLFFFVPLLFPEKKIQLLPYEGERPYRIKPYVDEEDTTRGSMGFFSDTTDSVITFNFALDTVNHDKAFSPISGFNIIFDKYGTENHLDLSGYDYLDIAISMQESFSFILYLKTFEYFTDTTKWWSQRYTETVEEVAPRGSHFSFRFRDFESPQWWIERIGKVRWKNLPPVPDYTKVMGIDFQNRPGMNKLHVPERMVITEISFRKSKNRLAGFCSTGALLWVCLISVLLMVFRKKNAGTTTETGNAKQPHVELKRRDDADTDRLVEYLKQNYQNPELSSEIVYGATGISTERISVLLKQRYGKGFREYLNFLRIGEAKYQLRKSDRTIAEVAFAVGYNSIPHFNRVFKGSMGMPPKEYRESGEPPEA